jgi:hypothetical protein
MSILQKRYEGFSQTPVLWKNTDVFNLEQFQTESSISEIDITINENLRLGKYIEHLVAFELNQDYSITTLAQNIQIQNDKITLGELDSLLLKNETPIHLEIIYKFYLYDSSVGDTEIEHFIGPNRKDTLVEKLSKLKNKQLPILYSKHCQPYLKALDLDAENMVQQVYFKAQLFVPYSIEDIQLKTLNNDCIVGFYITRDELTNFSDFKFYIPNKKDWLITPHLNVDWINYEQFKLISEDYLEEQFSPLCWIKSKNDKLQKLFLVWW